MGRLQTRVRDIAIHVVQIPRHYATHVAEGGSVDGKAASLYYVIELFSDDGQVGLGEISDIEPEWQPPDRQSLCEALRQTLVGLPLLDEAALPIRLGPVLDSIRHPELRRLTSCAIEMAWLDLTGRCTGLPVSHLLGGALREHVPVSWVAYIRSTQDVVAEVEARRQQGFESFKLKVGLDPDADDDRIGQVREKLGPHVHLRVDASGAWEPDEARARLHRLGDLGVDAVETPLSCIARSLAKDRPDLIDADPDAPAQLLAQLRSDVTVPIIEHVGDFEDPFTLALFTHRAVDAINVIPAQSGGLRRARRLLQLAESAGVPALLGSTVELGIGTAAALHVAAASGAVTWASDLVGPGLLTADVIEPATSYDAGGLRVPTGPGLGVTLSTVALEKWSI